METLLAPQNLPFSLALGAVVIWSILQILLGVGDAVGDIAIDGHFDGHIGAHIDGVDGGDGMHGVGEHSPIIGALDWLGIGKIPFSAWVILFGLCYSLSGLGAQALAMKTTGAFLPTFLAVPLALLASLPTIKITTFVLKPILPREETSAIRLESLVGREAQITVGTARKGFPAEAKVVDEWGKSHYVLVEPDLVGVEFPAGSKILLVKKRDHIFRALDNSSAQIEE